VRAVSEPPHDRLRDIFTHQLRKARAGRAPRLAKVAGAIVGTRRRLTRKGRAQRARQVLAEDVVPDGQWLDAALFTGRESGRLVYVYGDGEVWAEP
jgi:ribosomal protein L4